LYNVEFTLLIINYNYHSTYLQVVVLEIRKLTYFKYCERVLARIVTAKTISFLIFSDCWCNLEKYYLKASLLKK
jgi:hypothetical protein